MGPDVKRLELDATKTPLEQAYQLSEIVGHKMHAVAKRSTTIDDHRWVEFSVMVPVGTPTGWRTRFHIIKLIWKIMEGIV